MEIGSIESFIRYFDGIRGRTERVLDAIPPEHVDWRPGPGRFTFADLIRHLAAVERFMFVENVCGRPSRYPGHGPELADGHEAVRGYLTRMHEESLALLRALDPAALRERCVTPAGTPITAWKWLRAMVEHEVHHRGQIYLMLGLLDVATPPLYGLTSEQVRARSLPTPGT